MTRAWLAVILALVSRGTLAAESPACAGARAFAVFARSESFCPLPHQSWLSSRCWTGESKTPSCSAYRAIADATDAKLPPLKGGQNPSAVLCRLVGGVVVIGRDAKFNEQCFCGFRDRSLIGCDGLVAEQ